MSQLFSEEDKIHHCVKDIVLSILINIGSEYSFFVSTFHFDIYSIPNWNIPCLDAFVESLIQEKDKLVQMGVLQTSKNLALLVTDSNNVQVRGKDKGKEDQQSSNGASGSKKNKKFEKTRCPRCMRGFHPENQCMKKTIEQLSTFLEKTIFPFHKEQSSLILDNQ